MLNMKAWSQLVVAIVAAVWAALTDSATGDRITDQEWIVIAGFTVSAFGTWLVPNMDAGIAHYAKGFVSFMTAGLPVLYVVIPGGLTNAEMLEVLLAGAAAIGLAVGLKNSGYAFARKTTAGQGVAPPL